MHEHGNIDYIYFIRGIFGSNRLKLSRLLGNSRSLGCLRVVVMYARSDCKYNVIIYGRRMPVVIHILVCPRTPKLWRHNKR